MKKIFSVSVFFLALGLLHAKTEAGFSYHIGNDILFNQDCDFSYQSFTVNLQHNNLFLETGFLMSVAKAENDRFYTEYNSNTGLSTNLGYSFIKHFDEFDLSATPCLSLGILNYQEDEYNSYELFQTGTKVIFNASILKNRFSINLYVSPQFNFFNIMNSTKKVTETYYSKTDDSDGTTSYESVSVNKRENTKDIFYKSFQYEFGIGLNYRF